MAISIFPSTAAEFVSNNFVVDMNDTSNNTADTGGVKQAGPYSISFSSGDSSFDVYLIDEDGASVGYSNNTSIVASGLFSTVVILGVAQDEVVSFLYQGSVNNADGEGDEPGAGAYLESISPSDLPTIDDTATVAGGNFASDVEITFESGATVLSAKNIVRNSSTELVVTRPDALVEDDAPYTLKAINPGVTPPTGTDSHILTDAVTAGSDPTWVTGSELPDGTINQTYVGVTLEATDSDGTITDYSVTSGSLPAGLTLNSSTGQISGTPTGQGKAFTVTATDDGGNTNSKEFGLAVIAGSGGTITTSGGGAIHTFTTSDDFIADVDLTASYLIVGGGGGAGDSGTNAGGGGGGGGGVLSTFPEDAGASSPISVTAGTYAVTIGAGAPELIGSGPATGGSSSFGSFATAVGGGSGGEGQEAAGSDGAGGGGGGAPGRAGGSGSNGGDGGTGGSEAGAGGGGGGFSGTNGLNGGSLNDFGDGGDGTITNITGTPLAFAHGGRGGKRGFEGRGGSGGQVTSNGSDTALGGNGIVIVRY